jgi:hypothetical protein
LRGDDRSRRWSASSRAVFTFWLAFSPAGAAQEPAKPKADDVWIGKRVVAKVANLILRLNDEPIESGGRALRIYRVEEVDDRSLLLKSSSDRTSGWASGDDVIPIDRAADHFSRIIRVQPKDPFPRAMMALVLEDKQDHEQAIR